VAGGQRFGQRDQAVGRLFLHGAFEVLVGADGVGSADAGARAMAATSVASSTKAPADVACAVGGST